MLKINKKVEYALMVLKFMGERNDAELTSAREICEKFGTPFDTTSKVMQTMNSADILDSTKGIKGGYCLAKPLSEITYRELVNIIEGKRTEHFCENHKGYCDLYEVCNIAAPIDLLNRKINHYLSSLTLQELFFDTADFPLAKSIGTTLQSSQEKS
jgi:Rrf2 family protein